MFESYLGFEEINSEKIYSEEADSKDYYNNKSYTL